MNTMNKEMYNRDGSVDMVVMTSSDNYKVNLNKKYKLVGYAGNKTIDNFKNTIFGMDVGINSYGFISMTVIATLLAIAALVIMYFSFRI